MLKTKDIDKTLPPYGGRVGLGGSAENYHSWQKFKGGGLGLGCEWGAWLHILGIISLWFQNDGDQKGTDKGGVSWWRY